MSSSIICCRSPQKGSCRGKITATNPGRICVASDMDYENLKLSTLQMALEGWQNAIHANDVAKDDAKSKKKRISNWFQGNGGNYEDVQVTDIETPLVPEELISSATMIDGTSHLLDGQEGAGSDNNRDSIRKAMRVQISGDAGMLEMSMSKGSTEAYTKQNCNHIVPGALSGVIGGVGVYSGIVAASAGAGLASAAILPVAGGAIALGTAIAGCNYSLDLSAGVGGLSTSVKLPGVKIGLEGGMNFKFHVEHSSSITDEEGIETSVSFGLGDPDDGDEIVMDIYHDEIFGSFIFDIVGGITRCRWEKGTIKGEDPRIRILSMPSQFIFPDKEIVFDVELLNVGEHIYSYFLIAQDVDAETSALEIRLDTFESLDYEGISIKLSKEVPEYRFVRITRDPNGYEFKPAKLALRSGCEFAMDYEAEPVSEFLYNYVKPGTNAKRLKWIEPCPPVQWAGELKRDQKFLINSSSTNKESLTVTVFNPKYHVKNSTFVEKLVPNGRLENIAFLYRKMGTTTWRNGMMKSKNGLADMDFAQSEESDYGFISLDWFIGDGLLQDATYEVLVEAQCDKIAGPIEFQYSRDNIITGVIDFNPPEPYGYPQPLKDEVLLGQEMYVEFTEDLDCRIPFSFDIEMTITGPSASPTTSPSLSLIPSSSPSGIPSSVPSSSLISSRHLYDVGSSHRRLSQNSDFVLKNGDGLHVICEGRRIKFQVDYTSGLSVSQINGQEFTVEVGRIGGESVSYIADKNKNPIDHQTKGNVRFTKRFAAMDLSRASTRFRFLKRSEDISCSADGERQLRSELSQFSLQIDDRLNISDVFCDEKTSVLSAEVEIAPESNGRRLRKGWWSDDSTSSDIFEGLKDALNNGKSVGTEHRLLREDVSYSIRDIRVIPCKEDAEKYSIDVNSESDYSEHVEEDVDISMRNGGSRELKQIENEDKLKSIEGALLEMRQMENLRDAKLKDHDQKLLDEMENEKNVEINELKKELEKRDMEQKRELEKRDMKMKTEIELLQKQNMEMIRRLGESSNVNSGDGRMFFIQFFIILGCLSVFGAAIFFASRR